MLHLDHRGSIKANTVDNEILPRILGSSIVTSRTVDSSPITIRPVDIRKLQDNIGKVHRVLMDCTLCENRCLVDRIHGERGQCGIDRYGYIYQSQISYGEEPLISPTYEIYFSGCNIFCNYCHQEGYLRYQKNLTYLNIDDIIEDILRLKDDIRTISYLGGNPDQSLGLILKLMKAFEASDIHFPHVLNSNFMFSEDVIDIINEHFDIFLPDFKFGNDRCARSIAKSNRYVEIVQRNIMAVHGDNPIIIRHMPIRDHWYCCTKPVIDWIAQNAGRKRFVLSVLDSLYSDNSMIVNKAKYYASEKNISTILF